MYNTGTGYRIMPPTLTWRGLTRIMSEYSINLKVIEPEITFGAPVCFASFDKLPNFRNTMGKGLTAVDAKIGAIMEIIERYSATMMDRSIVIEGDISMLPLRPLYLRHVYCYSCLRWNNNCQEQYLNNCKQWLRAHSLVTGEHLLVPKEAILLTWSSEAFLQWSRLRVMDCIPIRLSTGLAAGNCLKEAILHGLLEVIERAELYPLHLDSGSIAKFSNYMKQKNERKPGGGFTKQYFRGYWPGLRNYSLIDVTDQALGCHFSQDLLRNTLVYHISDNFHGLRVHTVLAQLKIESSKGCEYIRGSGTHMNPFVAIFRALSEMIQIYGAVLFHHDKNEPECRIIRQIHEVSFSCTDMPNFSEGDIEIDLGRLIRACGKHGQEVIMVDLTRSDLNVPVVKIILPDIPYI